MDGRSTADVFSDLAALKGRGVRFMVLDRDGGPEWFINDSPLRSADTFMALAIACDRPSFPRRGRSASSLEAFRELTAAAQVSFPDDSGDRS